MSADFEAQTGELTIRGQRHTNGQRRTLAVHGWLDNAGSWSRIAPLLHGLDLVAIDCLGHGLSDHRPSSAGYHFVDHTETAMASLDALGWERCTLIGHSMGASIVMLLAAAFPERVDALVLCDGFGPIVGTEAEATNTLRRGLLDRARPPRRPRLYESRDGAMARMEKSFSTLTPEAMMALLERGLAEGPDGFYFRHDPRLRDGSLLRFTEGAVAQVLRSLECPVLLLRAGEGWLPEESTFASRVEHVRDLRVVPVEGSHHVHLNSPEIIAPHINRFLAEHPPTPAPAS